MTEMTRRGFQAGVIGAVVLGGMRGAVAAEGGMAMQDKLTPLRVPAQTIPVPTSISPQAQAFLSNAAERIAISSVASQAPRDQNQAADAALQMLRPAAAGFTGKMATIDLAHGARLYRVTPDGRTGRRAEVAYFDIHGGGFTSGGGEMCQVLAKLRAMDYGVEVFAVDYRLAPEHPYPAALDDCVAAWREVLRQCPADRVVAAGSSAGGNLVAALMLRAHADGLPLPAGLLMLTPATDLTGAGDTRLTNRFLDVSLYGGEGSGPAGYVGAADPKQPWLSPVFAAIPDGWPPTLLSSGTRDLLLSDTVRMHRVLRRAGVRAELHVTEAGCHGGFMGTAPEDRELMDECKRFCAETWGV